MSTPVAHRPPDPSGATESIRSAGGPGPPRRHDVPFQCSWSTSVGGPGTRTVRHTQALLGPVTVRLPKLSGGFPATLGILLDAHDRPFQYQATFPCRAQMSSGLTALTSSGTAGSRTFAHPRPL